MSVTTWTLLLPKAHRERHLKAEVRVTASCTGTAQGYNQQNLVEEILPPALKAKSPPPPKVTPHAIFAPPPLGLLW